MSQSSGGGGHAASHLQAVWCGCVDLHADAGRVDGGARGAGVWGCDVAPGERPCDEEEGGCGREAQFLCEVFGQENGSFVFDGGVVEGGVGGEGGGEGEDGWARGRLSDVRAVCALEYLDDLGYAFKPSNLLICLNCFKNE